MKNEDRPLTLVVATRNGHKLKEIKAMLAAHDIIVLGLDSFPRAPRVEEDADTFRANAAKKARQIARYTGCLSVADDSGLCVDALGGAPGVLSARFSGTRANDARNNAKLLRLLRRVPEARRSARFVCAIAVADRRGIIGVEEGVHRGCIIFSPRGKNGFGYDPLFYSPRVKKTFAQLDAATKNTISHRARAFAKARKLVSAYARAARRRQRKTQ